MDEVVGEQADRFAAIKCMLQLRDDGLNQQAMVNGYADTTAFTLRRKCDEAEVKTRAM